MSILTHDENPFLTDSPSVSPKDSINQLVSYARSFLCTTQEQYNSIKSLYSKARDWRNQIEKRRKELCEPSRKEISRINDQARIYTDALDTVIEIATAKSVSYEKSQEEARKAEESRLLKAAAILDIPLEEVYVPKAVAPKEGEAALATKTVYQYQVLDLKKVPLRYLQINDEAVKADIKLGYREIEGLEIYSEKVQYMRKR